jgi:hypothetical protein
MSELLRATRASSTSQNRDGTQFLDAHFENCRSEYEAMSRSVGLQPGWRVLHTAWGGGSSLPLDGGTGRAERIGPAPSDSTRVDVARAGALQGGRALAESGGQFA